MWFGPDMFLGSLIVLVVKVLWLVLLISLTAGIYIYLKKHFMETRPDLVEKYHINMSFRSLFLDICGFCGTRLKARYKFCPGCGKESQIGIGDTISTTVEDSIEEDSTVKDNILEHNTAENSTIEPNTIETNTTTNDGLGNDHKSERQVEARDITQSSKKQSSSNPEGGKKVSKKVSKGAGKISSTGEGGKRR